MRIESKQTCQKFAICRKSMNTKIQSFPTMRTRRKSMPCHILNHKLEQATGLLAMRVCYFESQYPGLGAASPPLIQFWMVNAVVKTQQITPNEARTTSAIAWRRERAQARRWRRGYFNSVSARNGRERDEKGIPGTRKSVGRKRSFRPAKRTCPGYRLRTMRQRHRQRPGRSGRRSSSI